VYGLRCLVSIVSIFHPITDIHEKALRGGTTLLTKERKKHNDEKENHSEYTNNKATTDCGC